MAKNSTQKIPNLRDTYPCFVYSLYSLTEGVLEKGKFVFPGQKKVYRIDSIELIEKSSNVAN